MVEFYIQISYCIQCLSLIWFLVLLLSGYYPHSKPIIPLKIKFLFLTTFANFSILYFPIGYNDDEVVRTFYWLFAIVVNIGGILIGDAFRINQNYSKKDVTYMFWFMVIINIFMLIITPILF